MILQYAVNCSDYPVLLAPRQCARSFLTACGPSLALWFSFQPVAALLHCSGHRIHSNSFTELREVTRSSGFLNQPAMMQKPAWLGWESEAEWDMCTLHVDDPYCALGVSCEYHSRLRELRNKYGLAAARLLVYVVGLGRLLYWHTMQFYRSSMSNETWDDLSQTWGMWWNMVEVRGVRA